MTAARVLITTELDVALEQLLRGREYVVSWPASEYRDAEVARSYELEARLWSVLFERSENRLIWRAALAAEAHARSWAGYWRDRAADRSLVNATAELGGAA